MVSQDIGGLMNLWAPEAVIADAKHTPDNPNDDARWRGRDAIRERYVVLVFPGNPNVDQSGRRHDRHRRRQSHRHQHYPDRR